MTIACGQVFWFVSMKWHSLTGGEDGLLNIHRAELAVGPLHLSLKDNVTLYFFVVAIFAVCIVFTWRLVHSPFGKALQAIRMNETRARFVGYDVWLTKWMVITMSGAFAGLSGGLFAVLQESAYPDVMNLHGSGFVVMATLIGGGLVSFWGPVIGAAGLHRGPRPARRAHRDVAPLVRPALHGGGALPARRRRRRVAGG